MAIVVTDPDLQNKNKPRRGLRSVTVKVDEVTQDIENKVIISAIGQNMALTCDIWHEDESGIMSDLTLSGLMIPIIKVTEYQNKTIVIDEVYFPAKIENGVLSCSGKFAASGCWVVTQNRIDDSLREVGIDWLLAVDEYKFRVAS